MIMSEQFKINNIQDWLSLPLLDIPAVKAIEEKGATYNVQKIGFFLADLEECHNAGIINNTEMEGDIPLPTIVIKEADGENSMTHGDEVVKGYIHTVNIMKADEKNGDGVTLEFE